MDVQGVARASMIRNPIVRIVFRVDASLNIGTGHVMRCLTLAEALRARGAICHFICREQPGNLISYISQCGYEVSVLPTRKVEINPYDFKKGDTKNHTSWLGCTWEHDAFETENIISQLIPEWLIVDHYAIDAKWELALKRHYKKLMIIDDLADRPHACDLLLDQNLGRDVNNYKTLVPEYCKLLIGPQYSLLRPEFKEWRENSLKRRNHPSIRNVMVSMGGGRSVGCYWKDT